MQTTVSPANCGLGFPTFSDFIKPRIGKSNFSQSEIADGFPLFASRRDLLQLTVSSIKPERHGRSHPPQRNTAADRTTAKETEDKTQSFDRESSKPRHSQEEIIALFRRIQASISKGESGNIKRRNSNISRANQSAESVLDVLHQSRKQVKDKVLSKEDKLLPRRREAPKKDQMIQDSPLRADFKLTRPPSNFVKRSPIPPLSSTRGQASEMRKEASLPKTVSNELDLHRLEKMKLPELKELAKSRGIKGYSKLKKGELVDLLKRSMS